MTDINKYKPFEGYLYTLLLLTYMLDNFLIVNVKWQVSGMETIGKALKLVLLCFAAILYIVKLIIERDYAYYFLLFPITVGLLWLSGTNIDDKSLVWNVIIIFLSKNIDFDRIVRIFFKFLLISTIVIIIFSKIGLTVDEIFIFSYGSGHSLGFPHPNNLGVTVLAIILAWIYLNYQKGLKFIFLVAYAGALFNLTVPLSRTSAMILILVPWLILIYRYSNKLKLHSIYFISSFSILFVFGISLFLMFHIRSTNYQNDYSSFFIRFSEGRSLLQTYGLHLLGSRIQFISSAESNMLGISSVILDCAYLRLLIYFGILASIIMIVLFLVLGRRIYKNNNQILMVIMVAFLILGLMEQNTLFIKWNFALLGTFAKLNSKYLMSL